MKLRHLTKIELDEIRQRAANAIALVEYGGRPGEAERELEAIEKSYCYDVQRLLDEIDRLWEEIEDIIKH